jgi:pimeloyl-ACP methyl ester carboxylesterase
MISRGVGLVLGLAIAGCGALPGQQATTRVAGAMQARALGSSQTMEGFMGNAFVLADQNRDGELSGPESKLNAAQFRVLDRDSDGAITRAEWEYQLPQSQVEKALVPFQPVVDATFEAIDTNKNGEIDGLEARSLAPASQVGGRAPEPITMSAVYGALERADANNDGKVSRREFPDFYTIISQDGGGRGWLGKIATTLLGGYLAVTSRIAVQQALHGPRRHNKVTPALQKLAFEDISFKTEDGLTLKGWYVPAAAQTNETVILAHGIHDCRDVFVRQGIIKMLQPRYNVVAFDLRNHGESEGNVTSFAVHEPKDIAAAKRFLRARGDHRLAVYGVSLGAATAIRAAALDPELLGVVDDCAYATTRSAISGFISLTFVPCPELIAAAALQRGNEELGADMTKVEPITQVRALSPRPFLVIHGAADLNISPEHSRLNYDAAGANKELWIVPGGTHAASAEAQPVEYGKRLNALFEKAFAAGRR